MIEALMAMLVTAFGVLGLVGLQARTIVSSLEGYQRAQALVLLNDITQRINLNRAEAAAYVASDIGAEDPGACSGLSGAPYDLCAWGQLIRGSGEQQAGNKLGAMQAARGCVTDVGGGQYLISVVWLGVQPTGPTTLRCGEGAYSNESLRRGASTVLRIANLSGA